MYSCAAHATISRFKLTIRGSGPQGGKGRGDPNSWVVASGQNTHEGATICVAKDRVRLKLPDYNKEKRRHERGEGTKDKPKQGEDNMMEKTESDFEHA